jgi:hypothetical protein
MSRRPMNMHIAAVVAAVGTSADDHDIYLYTCIACRTGHYIPEYISCHHLAIDIFRSLLY